jgi:hypothetical protein
MTIIIITEIKIYETIHFTCFCMGVKLNLSYQRSVFEERVLRRIFGPKRQEVKGRWRKFHNEELHNLYC